MIDKLVVLHRYLFRCVFILSETSGQKKSLYRLSSCILLLFGFGCGRSALLFFNMKDFFASIISALRANVMALIIAPQWGQATKPVTSSLKWVRRNLFAVLLVRLNGTAIG
jgi:hypothetical protein